MALGAGRIMEALGARRLAICLGLLLAGGTLLMAVDQPVAAWLGGCLAGGVVHAAAKPLQQSFINREVGDGERATIHSVASMATTVLGASMFLALAALVAVADLTAVLPGCLLVVMVGFGYAMWRLHRLHAGR